MEPVSSRQRARMSPRGVRRPSALSRSAGDGGDVRTRLRCFRVLRVAHADAANQAFAVPVARREAVVHASQSSDHGIHDRLRAVQRRALREQQPRLDDIALDVRKRLESDPAAREHRDGEEQHRDHCAEEWIAPAHRTIHEASRNVVAKPLDSPVERGTKAGGHASGAAAEAVGEMMGKNQEGFDETDRKHEDQHHRKHLEHPADVAGDECERTEHRAGRDEGRGDAGQDFASALDRGIQRSAAALEVARHVLADDDGIVHEQADRDQQSDHGDHVDRVAEEPHQVQAAEEGHRQSRHHPERETQAEEEPHRDEDENDALHAVAHEHPEPVAHHRCGVPAEHQGDSRCGAPAFFGNETLHRLRHPDDILLLRLAHLQPRRAHAVLDDAVLFVLEAVAHGGDVAEPDRSATFAREDHEVLELAHRATLVVETQQDVLFARLDGADGQVHALPGDRIGELRETHPVLAKHERRNVYPYLVIREALDAHERDFVERLEPCLEGLRVGLERCCVHRSAHRDRDNVVGAPEPTDDRRVGALGKVVDRVGLGAHFGDETVDVGAFRHPHDCRCRAFACIAADLFHVIHAVHRLFDGETNRLFDIACGSTGKNDPDLDLRDAEVGQGLAPDIGQRGDSQHHEKHHQEVRRGGVCGEVADQGATSVASATSAARAAMSSTGSSSMPSMAGRRSETTT